MAGKLFSALKHMTHETDFTLLVLLHRGKVFTLIHCIIRKNGCIHCAAISHISMPSIRNKNAIIDLTEAKGA